MKIEFVKEINEVKISSGDYIISIGWNWLCVRTYYRDISDGSWFRIPMIMRRTIQFMLSGDKQ
jgi:hypothetical protein